MKKHVTVTHFTMKIIRTYVHITCNNKILFVKNILACCAYSPTSPVFLSLSEHKHCDNGATNSNSENARSRIVTSLRGSVGTETKEDESSTGRVSAAVFRHVTPRSGLARVFKLMNRLFLYFSKFFSVNRVRLHSISGTKHLVSQFVSITCVTRKV